MNLSFLRFFKKTKVAETPTIISTPIVAIEKPASERLSKTVLPNSTRQLGVEPRIGSSESAMGVAVATVAPPNMPAMFPSFSPSASLPASTLVPPPPRSISLGNKGPRIVAEKSDIPDIIAERTISLALADMTLPQGLLNLVGLDPQRRLIFKAAELERAMSSGRPSVKLRAIYQQAPEFFTREIEEADPTEVTLPFGKVLEQFASFHVRSDQIADDALPSMETPFLQVTLEDSERFGTSMPITPAPISAPQIDPVPEPAPVAVVDPKAPIRLTVPKEAAEAIARPPVRLTPSGGATPAAPLAQKISPNGTGVPTPERVPASSGSPVPTPLPSPHAPQLASPTTSAPTKIPFKLSPAANDLRETAAPKIAGPPPASPPLPAATPIKVTPPSNDLRKPVVPKTAAPPPVASRLPAAGPIKISLPSNDLREAVVPKIAAAPAASPPLPTAIPIKITPPSDDLRETTVPKITLPKSEVANVAFAGGGSRIHLPLRPILRGLAPSQFSGSTDEVAENALIELPFAIVQPQLSLGKISISPAQFQAALPAEYRKSLAIEDLETPIALPLQDVLQNLPNESLKIRHDQEAVPVISTFETPFSQKAAEDEARLKTGNSPIDQTTPEPATAPTKPAIEPIRLAAEPIKVAPEKPSITRTPEPAIPAPISIKPPAAAQPSAARAGRDPLQLAFDTDEAMDAKNVVAHASRLPGVRACAIVFSDGLSLAGNIPAEFKIDPLCAIAPALVKKCQEQLPAANLGTFAGLTLSCTKSAVTFFADGDICLAALHWAGQEIEIATRTQLSSVTEGLARTYTQSPAVSA